MSLIQSSVQWEQWLFNGVIWTSLNKVFNVSLSAEVLYQ